MHNNSSTIEELVPAKAINKVDGRPIFGDADLAAEQPSVPYLFGEEAEPRLCRIYDGLAWLARLHKTYNGWVEKVPNR